MSEPLFQVDDSAAVYAVLDHLEAATLNDRERWPRLRTGDRKPISSLVRRLVYERDGFGCCYCGSSIDLQLDHIVPWSAGGSDSSDNLRALCSICNNERSNYRDPAARAALPVTRWCDWCGGWPTNADAVRAYCGSCGTTSRVSDLARLL